MKRKIETIVISINRGLKQQEMNMRTMLLAGAAVLALSQIAVAQGGNNSQPLGPANQNQTQTNGTSNQVTQKSSQQRIGSDLKNMLEKAGYTEIRVAPTSFMVRAKDASGNPVVIAISPDTFTEVTNLNASGGSTTGAGTNASGSGRFVSLPANAELSSKIVGLNVYNETNQDIGEIKDIALNQTGDTEAYVLSVGGFLGIGDHNVAVSPSAVKLTYNASDKKWHASMNATVEQLKAAPEFKYPKG